MTEIQKVKVGKVLQGEADLNKTRSLITTTDFHEYYVKHATSLETPEDIRLIFSNFQTVDTIFNNVSIWMNWKFCKQLSIFLMMKVLENEERNGEVKIDDTTTLNNYLKVIKHIKNINEKEIESFLEEKGQLLETVKFVCDNKECNYINIIKIPKKSIPDEKGVFSFPCLKCAKLNNLEYNPKKKD